MIQSRLFLLRDYPNVHTIHPKFYVLLVISILFRADKVDSMHIGTQGITLYTVHFQISNFAGCFSFT